jgi:hypothetical protein
MPRLRHKLSIVNPSEKPSEHGELTLSDAAPAIFELLGDEPELLLPSRPRRPDSAATEAKAIVAWVRRGVMTEFQARELIAVPPEIEAKLRAFAAKCPSDGPRLLLVVEFRARVLAEFDRQIEAG